MIEAPARRLRQQVDALAIGLAAVAMGAGRTRADQAVDPARGHLVDEKPGDAVTRGEPLARLLVRQLSTAAPIAERVRAAFSVGDEAPKARPLVLDRITARNSTSTQRIRVDSRTIRRFSP